jgi:hypothetical protein
MWSSQSTGVTPGQLSVAKIQRLIVVWAFKRDDEGELVPAFDPREMQSERAAVEQAKLLGAVYDGSIAWYRDCDPIEGEYDDAVVLYRHGSVPQLE